MTREILIGKIERTLELASYDTLHTLYVLLCQLLTREGV